jgi:hypothetical protein
VSPAVREALIRMYSLFRASALRTQAQLDDPSLVDPWLAEIDARLAELRGPEVTSK